MNPVIKSLPILILYPHNRCNCRCIMCDIWKLDSKREISPEELQSHLSDILALHVKRVVFSGGEPLMHSDLFRLAEILRDHDIRTTMLSTGILLERHAKNVATHFDDVIISLDGPPEIHDQIRNLPRAFELLLRGIIALHEIQPEFPIAARCTVQRANCTRLCDTATTAKRLGLRSISYLAADVTSSAFNRPDGWTAARQDAVAPAAADLPLLEREMEALWREWGGTGFVLESREKLGRIVLHFRARLGLAEPVAPRCNAPWVSSVIEADGIVRPCFFHPPIGSLHGTSITAVLNGAQALSFRTHLDVSTNPVCKRCVCSLFWDAQ